MAARPKKQTALDGIETGPMSVPKMDRISVTFALMLDSFAVDAEPGRDEDEETSLYLRCSHCTERLCQIEDGDDLRTLFNTALAHTC